MPELPEVEVVRLGLAPLFANATISGVEVRDARSLKRHRALVEEGPHLPGHGKTLDDFTQKVRAADFEKRMTGRQISTVERRGKFMWAPLQARPEDRQPEALVMHLGMSGQLLIRSSDASDEPHVRTRIWIDADSHPELRVDFVDQRLFGSLSIDKLVPDLHASSPESAKPIPASAMHIAPDPLDTVFDDRAWIALTRSKKTAIKTAIMNQSLISGVGNIYADEALWAARIHPQTPANRVSVKKLAELITHIRQVFHKALAEGGTSFDSQYVNVNGQAGYFAHSLNAYGRSGLPCSRCATFIRRVSFGGRSSHFCPSCQRLR